MSKICMECEHCHCVQTRRFGLIAVCCEDLTDLIEVNVSDPCEREEDELNGALPESWED